MLSEKTILKTYAASDEDQRLSMYLTYRDLRRQFHQIDMAPSKRPQQVPIKHPSFLGQWIQRPGLASFCCGWLRFCRPIK